MVSHPDLIQHSTHPLSRPCLIDFRLLDCSLRRLLRLWPQANVQNQGLRRLDPWSRRHDGPDGLSVYYGLLRFHVLFKLHCCVHGQCGQLD